MRRLEGKRAMVTGAGSGIGRATALLFAQEGASVLAVDCDGDSVTETASCAVGGRVIAMVADVGGDDDVRRMVGHAVAKLGGLDVVHANAGISGGTTPLLEQSVALWHEVLRVNLIGAFLAVRHAAPLMVAQGRGSIICTASVAGLRANAASSPYSASKAGVISLVQTAAGALSGTGVRVNALCPWLIETGMAETALARARARGMEEQMAQLNPLRRAGTPEEIAAVALFLASDESSYVNGQAIAVDGGLSSGYPFLGAPPP